MTGDVLSVILSIYSFDEGADLPLPGVDEVLLCSSETAAEDVTMALLIVFLFLQKETFIVVIAAFYQCLRNHFRPKSAYW